MMTRIKILAAAAVMVCALSPRISFANPSEDEAAKAKSFMEKMEARQEELYKELNLSDDQKKALEENKNRNRAQKKALFERIRANKDLMRQELQKEPLDMSKVSGLNAEFKELQARMADSRLQGILEVRKILTPEQFNNFLSKMEDRKGRWGRQNEGARDSVPHLPAENK